MDSKIIVAAHKSYPMPKDPLYYPVQVGAEGKASLGYQRDDQGENISFKNPGFCELTGLYWAWKNLDCQALGLAHYRRHFKGDSPMDNSVSVLSRKQLDSLLETCDCVLPKKQRYFIETIYSHYQHTHYEADIRKTRQILAQQYPEYLKDFDACMKSRSSHMFNMFVMKKELADAYCSFLFDILFRLEDAIDVSGYDAFQARVFGRIGEILLDVWIRHNRISYTEVPVVYMEKINWLKKGTAFLQAKFFHKKYKGSF